MVSQGKSLSGENMWTIPEIPCRLSERTKQNMLHLTAILYYSFDIMFEVAISQVAMSIKRIHPATNLSLLWYWKAFFLFSNLAAKAAKSDKSTASRAIYARSSVIFPHRMVCQGEVYAVKRGPKLNLRRGGGGNPTTLTAVSSLVCEFWQQS